MAADTQGSSSQPGTQMYIGRWRSIITAAETNVLKVGDGKVAAVIIANVGTSATLDIYDTAAADTSNKIFEWVSADGKGTFALQCPMALGIRVVTGGTFGRAVVIWT